MFQKIWNFTQLSLHNFLYTTVFHEIWTLLDTSFFTQLSWHNLLTQLSSHIFLYTSFVTQLSLHNFLYTTWCFKRFEPFFTQLSLHNCLDITSLHNFLYTAFFTQLSSHNFPYTSPLSKSLIKTLYAHMLIVVAFSVVKIFGFLVITRYHDIFEGRQ